MILTKYIPTDHIRSMKIYINRDRLPLSAIVERDGPHGAGPAGPAHRRVRR